MPKFRKKPVEIEAVLFLGFNQNKQPVFSDEPNWLKAAQLRGGPVFVTHRATSRQLKIATLEGELEVSEEDWIIQGIKGELYPCKPDIFAATYARAE